MLLLFDDFPPEGNDPDGVTAEKAHRVKNPQDGGTNLEVKLHVIDHWAVGVSDVPGDAVGDRLREKEEIPRDIEPIGRSFHGTGPSSRLDEHQGQGDDGRHEPEMGAPPLQRPLNGDIHCPRAPKGEGDQVDDHSR